MDNKTVAEHSRVHRLPERAHYERALINAIIDEALVCHVGFAQEGQPFVIPTLHPRRGDTLLLHGARASRLLKHVAAGAPLCVAITLVDGLVLARSAFHHSINYRSVVLFGTGTTIEGPEEKLRALETLTEHIAPGRWAEVRSPSSTELNATSVVALAIDSASAKVRSGPPRDDEEDYALPTWAGVLPLELLAGQPVADPRLPAGIDAPAHVRGYRRSRVTEGCA